jgi:hypothetical protein
LLLDRVVKFAASAPGQRIDLQLMVQQARR